ncbi:MAG: exosome complex RNA-binding protein Rrp4 [Candidatus Nanoarchaeia archaeon]|jgi:exosome complex component RRP4|nr:exosome complex RNA-binding protein Rrp4 [Candidatus Nanoarchaeia archaeon]MDD3993909.1 exosome complex RNA-binding protein Rrp4 [Candidatus Nanoarchaeia archaeon]MDD4563373.1 exosome complex RNA-binding protein Rrp4 [Candidatus Nanoarchaeia archaeon]
MENSEERQIVIPGENIVSGDNFLPGEGAYRDGNDVVAKRYGIVNISDNYVRVVPLSGVYFPRRNNVIIGTISGITMNGWLIDFGGSQNAFLSLNEVPRYINKNELKEFLDFGDSVIVKIWDTQSRGIDTSMKQRGLGKIEGGMLMNVNPNKVPRIIGKEGSMVKIIRNATDCNLTVGQNGVIWIKSNKIENEILAKKIIDYIVENSVLVGLTEKVEKYIKSLGLEIKENNLNANDDEVEIIEEETDKEE